MLQVALLDMFEAYVTASGEADVDRAWTWEKAAKEVMSESEKSSPLSEKQFFGQRLLFGRSCTSHSMLWDHLEKDQVPEQAGHIWPSQSTSGALCTCKHKAIKKITIITTRVMVQTVVFRTILHNMYPKLHETISGTTAAAALFTAGCWDPTLGCQE